MDELRDEILYAVDRLRHESGEAIVANTHRIDKVNSVFTDTRDFIQNLASITELLYSALGVTIYDGHGDIRDVEDIRAELLTKNPEIKLPFESLMHFDR